MIEAILDRTLIQPDLEQAELADRLEKELPSLKEKGELPMDFHEFVNKMAKKFEISERKRIERAFWDLVEDGVLNLSHDFKVVPKGTAT